MMRTPLLVLGLLVATCTRVESTPDSSLPPTNIAALLAWLQAGAYRSWTPEPTVRPSFTAHGQNVRAWLSPILVEDLRSGRTRLRKGAAMVKELYFDGKEQVIGYSVMRKVRRRSGKRGRGWYFFETFDGTTPVVPPGRRARICVSCHRDGHDYYLLGFRP